MKHKGLFFFILLLLAAALLYLFRPSDGPQPNKGLAFLYPQQKNQYDPEAFYKEDGFLRYEAAEHRIGIDVSTHQGWIDWYAVADSGVDFAILRAGYRGSTVGELYEDDYFAYNLEQAQAAGLQLGVYFFSQALNEAEAREEAAFVCELLEGQKLALPVFYDWEFIGGRVSDPGDIPMTDCALAFCEAVRDHGYEAGVYFNQDYGYNYLELGRLNKYTLWLAEYADVPSFRYHFDCLQYTDNGYVSGIEGAVDLDLWILNQEE